MTSSQIKTALAFVASIALLVTAFSNCGQSGNIVAQVPVDLAEDISGTITNCNTAQNTGTLKSLSQTITFEDTRTESGKSQICEFASSAGQITASGNLSKLNEYMRSRYEQKQKLNVPSNAVICDVKMTTDVQKFRYDDVFFFTFNNHLLATNNKTAINERLTPLEVNLNNKPVKFYDYDWPALRGAKFVNVADDYCAGKDEGLASCSWPISEQDGNIVFSFDQQILVGMGLAKASDDHTFGFVITGDDDPALDCYHQKLSFAMTIKYYVPSSGN